MANTTTTKTVTWTHGLNTIYAGQPLDTNGKPVMDNTAVGIVAEDLHAPDRSATVITAGEWDESVNEARFHIPDAVKIALSDITFSVPPQVPLSTVLADYVLKTELATELEDYVKKTDLESTEDAGIVEEPAG